MSSSAKSDRADMRASPGERPTLKTIARMTGLGITTVSRALKDAPDIGTETKERVRQIAEKLGYQPNRAGVRLRTGKTNVIALVLSVEEELMGFANQLVFGISEVLTGSPYHLVLTPHSLNRDPMVPVRYILDTGSADGIIISRIEPDDPRVRLLHERNLPFVTHGRTSGGIVHPYHDFDNEEYAWQGVKKLVETGRKRIAILQPPSHLSYWRHTRDGFERGLRDFGATEVNLDGVSSELTLETIKQRICQIMAAPDAPDGILSISGSATVAVIAGMEAAGKKLGVDVDIVSKQSAEFLNWIRPEILSVNEDVRQAGRELAKALLARIDGADPAGLQSMSKPVWPTPHTGN